MDRTGSLIIRSEQPADLAAIRFVHEQAFGRPDEADLVDNLRSHGAVLCSFVAVLGTEITGHILFTRMSIETTDAPIPAVALAPVAVLPEHQRTGVGSSLIRHGLETLRISSERIVLVLGEPHYYTRFGFSTNQARDLATPFPPEFYMALELVPGALSSIRGKVKYAPPFGLQSP